MHQHQLIGMPNAVHKIIIGNFNAKVGEGRRKLGKAHGLGIVNLYAERNWLNGVNNIRK